MAISINPLTFVINVPRADMALIQSTPTEIRELNLNTFRLNLRAYEAAEYGIYLYKTHNHNTEVTLGSLTFARVIEILSPYTVTFEDGQYAVNLVNANSNVSEKTNVNQVSVRSSNSAGLVAATSTVTTEDINAIADAVWDELVTSHTIPGSTGKTLKQAKSKATLASLK
jgi:hypothetical protein